VVWYKFTGVSKDTADCSLLQYDAVWSGISTGVSKDTADCSLLEYDAVWSGISLPEFRMTLLSPPLGYALLL
jgi:hypothetical protein